MGHTPEIPEDPSIYYEKKHQDNAISKAVEKIQDWLDLETQLRPPFSYRDFFSLLLPYRNQPGGWGTHGATLMDSEYKERADILYSAFEQLLVDVRFLADYVLVHIRDVRKQPDRTWSLALDFCVGRHVIRDPKPLVAQDLFYREHLYLCRETESDELIPFLDLYPLITCANCPSCKDLNIFVLNWASDQRLEYLSYGCGHRLAQSSEHITYFSDFLDLAKWQYNASEKYAGRVSRES